MTTANAATPTTASTRSGAPDDSSCIRVWDPLVRIFHWSLTAGFATAYVLEDRILALHVWVGYLVLAAVAIRVVWGWIGPRHARFRDFVRGPHQTLAYLRDALHLQAPRFLGHNPAGGAMVIALLVMVTATALSGMALYGAMEFAGPLAGVLGRVSADSAHTIEEIHESLASLTLMLVCAHVAGVLFSSLSHHENLALAMITGNKRKQDQ